MALDKAQLKSRVRSIADDLYANTDNKTSDECREIFATRLSDAVDEFVRTALVTVNTTGTAAAQHGTGTLS
jgi:hypothetical protein